MDYFKDLFKEAARFPNIRQIINTNGLLMTEEWAKDLIESKADITFSIDGVTKDVYEYIRKDDDKRALRAALLGDRYHLSLVYLSR